MAKFFKIIVELLIKNSNGLTYFIEEYNLKPRLPKVEIDFNSTSLEDFLEKKLGFLAGRYSISAGKITKKEIFGEMSFLVEAHLKDIKVDLLSTDPQFYALDNLRVNSEISGRFE